MPSPINPDAGTVRADEAPRAGAATTPGEDAPFGAPRSRRRMVVQMLVSALLIVAVVAAVVLMTRDAPSPVAEGAHVHGAAGGTDAPQPVMLVDRDAERIGVTYATVEAGALRKEIRTVGQVTFDETRVRTISLKVDGWIERLHVDFTGQYVTAGAPLFALYSPMLVATQEELLLAMRLQRDVANGSAEARSDADDLTRSALRRLAYWDVPPAEIARIQRSGEVQRTVTMRAHVGGFVIDKAVLEGQRVMAGEPLYRVAELGTVWVEGEVFEQDLSVLRLGQRATAGLEAFPGQEFAGRIAYIYPTLDPETRTARVRVELPNPGHRLKPGMYATLRIDGAARAAALTVPRTAVLTTGERSLVFVRRADGMLEPREVAVGISTDARTEILRGVTAGETVVASATFLVDAESNLGTIMGGMGNMPGMDMTAPGQPNVKAAPPARPSGGEDSRPHADHEE